MGPGSAKGSETISVSASPTRHKMEAQKTDRHTDRQTTPLWDTFQSPSAKLQFLSHIGWSVLKLLKWSFQPFPPANACSCQSLAQESEKQPFFTGWQLGVCNLKNVYSIFAVSSMFGFWTSSFFHVWDFLCDVKHMWPTNRCEKHGPNHHFSSEMAEIELSFHSPCLSSKDRDPEWELEDGWWHDDGDGRWKLECPVVRQAAERSDAIGPGGVCCCLAPLCRASTAHSS